MATAEKNLSAYDKSNIPNAKDMRFGIVVSEWNLEITERLLSGAIEALKDCGAKEDKIKTAWVPGAYELPFGAQTMLIHDHYDAIICLGAVIRGETAHFDFVCDACANGIKDVSLKLDRPVIFGVLTDDKIEQSRARSGGELGNKGTESAISAIKLVAFQRSLAKSWGTGFNP